MTKTKRTDPHRPGAIIPAHYDHWIAYSLPTTESGWPVASIRVDCATPFTSYDALDRPTYHTPTCPDTGRCCVESAERHAHAEGRAVFGARGKCGVCGACFVYGSLFRHESGAMVHMGHDCADKYEAMYDLSAWELENRRERAAAATELTRSRKATQRAEFLDANPGLAEALAVEHPIIADIGARFVRFAELSPKQVALVIRLADEVRNPKPVVEEIRVEGPLGRCDFTGEIVSAKITDGAYGAAWKVTVKVRTDAGVWFAWGTAPRDLLEAVVKRVEQESRRDREEAVRCALRGSTVTLRATLEAGREPHFRFMKRPVVVGTSPQA